jgi:hypothetical protein
VNIPPPPQVAVEIYSNDDDPCSSGQADGQTDAQVTSLIFAARDAQQAAAEAASAAARAEARALRRKEHCTKMAARKVAGQRRRASRELADAFRKKAALKKFRAATALSKAAEVSSPSPSPTPAALAPKPSVKAYLGKLVCNHLAQPRVSQEGTTLVEVRLAPRTTCPCYCWHTSIQQGHATAEPFWQQPCFRGQAGPQGGCSLNPGCPKEGVDGLEGGCPKNTACSMLLPAAASRLTKR